MLLHRLFPCLSLPLNPDPLCCPPRSVPAPAALPPKSPTGLPRRSGLPPGPHRPLHRPSPRPASSPSLPGPGAGGGERAESDVGLRASLVRCRQLLRRRSRAATAQRAQGLSRGTVCPSGGGWNTKRNVKFGQIGRDKSFSTPLRAETRPMRPLFMLSGSAPVYFTGCRWYRAVRPASGRRARTQFEGTAARGGLLPRPGGLPARWKLPSWFA